ncbi:hypothetical protein M404DRAFT_20954 [Pisolithus tinctorius Marx 270]|uniref:DUF6534 domain-containing protein n=1 Tax=Pisolithus tinctorius Marx 270 TaxID=870435 RepID=A0A0C3PQB0_PISTI|nr:hypothetical protein M404DRAFT_20954 [Pisolithus tinctorius Marx 270]
MAQVSPTDKTMTDTIRFSIGLCTIFLARRETYSNKKQRQLLFINNALSFASHARLYTSLPAVSLIALAEAMITLSLCVLLYERGSRSAVPRTKSLLNTLIIYAVNRCLLTLLVILAELTVDAEILPAWTMALTFTTPKPSLNTREKLRFQGSGCESDLHMNVVHLAKPPKLSEDRESSKDREGNSDARKWADIDVTAVPLHDETTVLRREGKV